jgi:hypothetical protein
MPSECKGSWLAQEEGSCSHCFRKDCLDDPYAFVHPETVTDLLGSSNIDHLRFIVSTGRLFDPQSTSFLDQCWRLLPCVQALM